VGVASVTVGKPDVDDPAPSRRTHPVECSTRTQHSSVKGALDGITPRVPLDVLPVAGVEVADIVDEDIDAAEFGLNGVEQRIDRLWVGDIPTDGRGINAIFLRVSCRCLGRVGTRVVVDGDICPGGSQRQQQLAADTLCAPRYKCCSPLKLWYQLHARDCARSGLNLRRVFEITESPAATLANYRLPNAVSKVSCARS